MNWLTIPSPFYLGHRGVEAHAPENTLTAFRAAFAHGFPIETDLQTTLDQTIVCIHDETVDRTTNGTGRVDQMTLAQLQQLDAGAWFSPTFAGERIPSVGELLACAPANLIFAELKDHRSAPLLARLVSEQGLQPYVVFNCEATDPLRVAAAIDPTVLLAPTYKRQQGLWPALSEMIGLGARFCSIEKEHPDLTREWVQACHAAGIRVVTWTHRQPGTRDQLLALGVDGFTCSDPAFISGTPVQ